MRLQLLGSVLMLAGVIAGILNKDYWVFIFCAGMISSVVSINN